MTSFIDRKEAPWSNLPWMKEPKQETRLRLIRTTVLKNIETILTQSLSITPEVLAALSRTRENVEAAAAEEMISQTDQLPVGFKPEPFPAAIRRPAVEKNPVPEIRAAVEAGASVLPLIPAISSAANQNAAAVVAELHAEAKAALPDAPKDLKSFVCCPTPFRSVEKGALRGPATVTPLQEARELLRTAVSSGTRLWPEFEIVPPETIEQTVDDSVFFKLFLKYCYYGANVGEQHEFSHGNVCRQCGLALGKPVDLVDFAKEGASILAAQQGPLQVQVTPQAFEALSNAVRRRRLLAPTTMPARPTWVDGLRRLLAVLQARTDIQEENGPKLLGAALEAVLTGLEGRENQEFDETERAELWGPVVELFDTALATVEKQLTQTGGPKRAAETKMALEILMSITEDPFIEGPRTLQEYWCAKPMATGSGFEVTTAMGARWFAISREHNQLLNKIVVGNSQWLGPMELTDSMKSVFRQIARVLGPLMAVWVREVRPAVLSGGAWVTEEAQRLLRAMVLQTWADAVTPNSWMYGAMGTSSERQKTYEGVAVWTRALMLHVKRQYIRYSKDTIRTILAQRAELERTSVVQEFESVGDDDQRAAMLLSKQFGIGRWAIGKMAMGNKYDPDLFEFETEQRHRMGVVEPPVDPSYVGGAAVPAGEDYGFALAGGPEDGYDANQGADGDDY